MRTAAPKVFIRRRLCLREWSAGDAKIRQMPCVFCSLPPSRIVDETATVMVICDGFPVSEGHTLVIPKRHVASFFDLTGNEFEEIMTLLARAKLALDQAHSPSGYNIGINDGAAAGQTVPHVHVHLIPRYQGDSPDPRGGVRWIFPEKAAYWDK